jgi:hypothetical protein
MESHARLFGNNFDAHYFDLLVHLFQEYYTIPTRQMQLRESFGNLIWYFIYHLQQTFLSEYTNNFFDTYQSISNNIEHTETIRQFNEYLELFLNIYDSYLALIQIVQAEIQEVQNINPGF